jgi:hypothetical protein
MRYYSVLKKEETPAFCDSMDELGGDYAKRSKLQK